MSVSYRGPFGGLGKSLAGRQAGGDAGGPRGVARRGGEERVGKGARRLPAVVVPASAPSGNPAAGDGVASRPRSGPAPTQGGERVENPTERFFRRPVCSERQCGTLGSSVKHLNR